VPRECTVVSRGSQGLYGIPFFFCFLFLDWLVSVSFSLSESRKVLSHLAILKDKMHHKEEKGEGDQDKIHQTSEYKSPPQP